MGNSQTTRQNDENINPNLCHQGKIIQKTESKDKVDCSTMTGGKSNPLSRKPILKELDLAMCLESIIRTSKPEYDSNFQKILTLEDQEIEDETTFIIKKLVLANKDNPLLSLFQGLRRYLFDLCKRKEGFEECVQNLRRISEKEKVPYRASLKRFEVKDVIIFLLESCSAKSMAKIGPWLVSQFYPLPIFYAVSETAFKPNFDCGMELLFQIDKPLIVSIGSKSASSRGKSSLLLQTIKGLQDLLISASLSRCSQSPTISVIGLYIMPTQFLDSSH